MWNDVHGGLTPPAPALRCECLPAKSDFCDGPTHVPKSGGREPAVGREGRRNNDSPPHSHIVQRTFARAAGVSPPWCAGNTVCRAAVNIRALFNELPHRAYRERRPSARRGGVRHTISEHPILFSAQQTENREWRALFNERTAMLAEITNLGGQIARLRNGHGSTSAHARRRLRLSNWLRRIAGTVGRICARRLQITGRICTDRLQVGGLGPVERPL
jgi:hypothetical protein